MQTLSLMITLRAADGALTRHVETHRTGTRDERGAILVSFTDEFPYIRADELADELGGEVVEVESAITDDDPNGPCD